MHIDTSHRGGLVAYDESAYHAFADEYVSGLSKIQNVKSVVICGSLAKNDLVPGWSDIDIIIFISSDTKNLVVLEEIKRAIKRSKGKITVGLGLDIVYEDQFLSTHKLCGRPYMMTYEVAGYGQLRYGTDLFKGITYNEDAKARVDNERYQLIAAEVHNWRREFVRHRKREISWLFTCAKALLRILQCETGPNLTPPIGCADSLRRFVITNPKHPATAAFVSSVEIRQRWSQFLENRTEIDATLTILEQTLNSYPIRLPRV